MSKQSLVSVALHDRCGVITIAGGYQTDIGATVYRGRRAIPDDAVPCVSVVELDDFPGGGDGETHLNNEIEYAIEAHVLCDPDHPSDAAHQAIADIKRAIWSGDLRLGGLAKSIKYAGRVIEPREANEAGQPLVAAQVRLRVQIVEDLAAP